MRSNINIHLESCFWIPDAQYSLSFSSAFGLDQLKREMSGTLAAKCSAMFTSYH